MRILWDIGVRADLARVEMAQIVGLHLDEQLEHWRYVQAVCLTRGGSREQRGKREVALDAPSWPTPCLPLAHRPFSPLSPSSSPSPNQPMSRHVTAFQFEVKIRIFVTSTMVIVIILIILVVILTAILITTYNNPRREQYQAALRTDAKNGSGQRSNGGVIHRCTRLNTLFSRRTRLTSFFIVCRCLTWILVYLQKNTVLSGANVFKRS